LRYLFSDCVVDTDLRELQRAGEAVSLEPLAFDILVYLIRNRDRVVSKDELRETVWEGRVVSESTLSSWMTTVRGALGDNGEDQRLIRTMPRRGFRFVGTVSDEQKPANGTNVEPPSEAVLAGGTRPQEPPLPPKASEPVRPASHSRWKWPALIGALGVGTVAIAAVIYVTVIQPRQPDPGALTLRSGEYDVVSGAHRSTFNITVTGSTVSGMSTWTCCPGPRTDPINGTIDRKKVTFTRICIGQGAKGQCVQVYSGDIGDNSASGTYTMNGSPAGLWSMRIR
jgi:DNA-binding winged helix-turn-helix (wHTH) protein